MKKIIILFFIASILSTGVFANGCNHIVVSVSSLSGFGIERGAVHCKHGKVLSTNYPSSVTLDIVDAGSWGPDCTLSLAPLSSMYSSHDAQPAKYAQLEVQQNLCALAGGDNIVTDNSRGYKLSYSTTHAGFPSTAGGVEIWYVKPTK